MRIRPTSITAIGWIVIVLGLLSLSGNLRQTSSPQFQQAIERSPLPASLHQAIRYIGPFVELGCGYFLLRGRNSARYLFLVWSVVQGVCGFVVSPYPILLMVSGAVLLLFAWLLFRPSANTFFADDRLITNEMTIRQITGLCLFIFAGFCLITITITVVAMPFDYSMKWTMAILFLVGPIPLLVAGRFLSPNLDGHKEIGIVLLASAAGSALFVVALGDMFSRPEFQQSLPPGRQLPTLDYLSAAMWIGLLSGLGGMAIYVSRRKARGRM